MSAERDSVTRIFTSGFFHQSVYPPAPESPNWTVSNFFENLWRYSQIKVDHRCRWQTANNWDNIRLQTPESELEGKNIYIYIYMFPLLPKGDQRKLLKFFWLKIFSICHWCRWHRWQTLSCECLREFSKKNRNGLNGILWGWGETDSWKEPEAKNLVTLSF